MTARDRRRARDRPLRSAGLCAAFVALGAAWCSAADWPNWRGPQRNGVVEGTISIDWKGEAPPLLWRADVGTGFSAVSIAAGRAYTLGNVEDEETLVCLDASTGEVVWKQSHPEPLDPNLFEGGPTATPTVAGDAVYTISRRGLVQCFAAATGEIRWQVDLPKICEVNVPTWGFAGSPVVVDDLLLLNAGRAGTALDRRSGAVVWKSDSDDDAAYTTPVLMDLAGEPATLLLSAKALHAVDVATGRELWDYRWVTRYGINAADPLVAGESIWLSSGYAKGATLLHTGAADEPPTEVYRTRELRNQMAPGVLIGSHVYAMDGDAGGECALRCVELATGAVQWSEPLEMSTLIAIGDRLVIFTESGELIIAAAEAAAFRPLRRASVLSGKCWTPPAWAEGRLYCRNAAGAVICLDVR